MAKPTVLPIWNTDETNSTEPDAAHKLDGWLAPGGVPEKPPFQTFNFWQNSVYKWIAWIEEFFNPSLDKSVLHNITSDANYTLTADQILYSRIEITDTGVLLSTGRNIVVDNIEHTFLFVNSTLQTLTIKTPTGLGVSVPAGEARQVRNDTVNVVEFEDDNYINNDFGVNQTWQNLTGSRSSGVTYTNTTGKPIMVYILVNGGTLDVNAVLVDSIPVGFESAVGAVPAYFVVPNGSTYVANGISFSVWSELR